MLNESVIQVLKNAMWDLATCADGEPNVVPVAFKDVTDDGKLVVGDVFLETTLNNIKKGLIYSCISSIFKIGIIACFILDAISEYKYEIKFGASNFNFDMIVIVTLTIVTIPSILNLIKLIKIKKTLQ